MKIVLAGFCLFIWMGWGGCWSGNKDAERLDLIVFLADSVLREGDLVFRRGTGLASRAVLVADNHSVYSHTGIVIRDGSDWKVVHVVPGEPDFKGDPDRIKMDRLDVFFAPERAHKGALMRVESPEAGISAAQHAVRLFRTGILFDHNYDLDDTTRMYCTELIQKIFLREGIDLTGGKLSRINLPLFSGDYILPGDLQNSPHIKLIYEF